MLILLLFLTADTLNVITAAKTQPFKENARIGVVGAGPSGIHMASELNKLGYKPTILEKTSRIGGKSLTLYRDVNTNAPCVQNADPFTGIVDTEHCISHEMGTCFLHNGYGAVRDLIEEYHLTPEVSPEGRAMFSSYAEDQFHSQEMGDFITSSIEAQIEAGLIKIPWWVPKFSSTLTVMNALLASVEKYNSLHAELVGDVEFSMPNEPSPEKFARMDMTFEEFLVSNDMIALNAFLSFAHAAQGYGYVSSIPAFYGLWWVSPELLNGYIQMSMHQQIEEICSWSSDNWFMKEFVRQITKMFVGGDAAQVYRTTTMLPEGYGKIWPKIASHHDLDIRFDADIVSIDRQLGDPSAPVIVTLADDQVLEFDFLIYTAPHAHSNKIVKDLHKEETEIFDSLESYVLATTLYTSDSVDHYSISDHNAPIMYNVDKMSNVENDGQWYADRNDMSIFGNSKKDKEQMRVGYQFFEEPCAADSTLCDSDRFPKTAEDGFEEVSAKVLEMFEEEMANQKVDNASVQQQFAWPYFHHFPSSSVSNVWRLYEMQGSRKTMWIGASASFESVHDVINYNLQILDRFGLKVKGGETSGLRGSGKSEGTQVVKK
eukprot:CAMPEP_0118632508 /NCGR_PEP_ID=MMETSP0785-20121206/486_1 /TAXON_ID=91992 /ORGANISM="Bolidomonas pacifica, Strain CCMP 1866" /LENGTH=600 /DNA_ID=CAMNT_0006523291 /DNA_START=1 /DNA_END=1803 /DNA_ORIENTATION=-